MSPDGAGLRLRGALASASVGAIVYGNVSTVVRPWIVLAIGGVLSALVVAGALVDQQRVPTIRDCATETAEQDWERCVDREYAKVSAASAFIHRTRWWRRAVVLVIGATAVGVVLSLAVQRSRHE